MVISCNYDRGNIPLERMGFCVVGVVLSLRLSSLLFFVLLCRLLSISSVYSGGRDEPPHTGSEVVTLEMGQCVTRHQWRSKVKFTEYKLTCHR